MVNRPVRAFGELLAEPLRNGLNRPKKTRGIGVKMVNMGQLFAHNRIGDVAMEYVPLSDSEAERYLLQPGDLLFARQSLVLDGAGKCSIFLGALEPVTYEGHIIRARIDAETSDALFYYYFFQSPQGRATIAAIVEQVAAAGIRGSDLARLRVPYPEVTEQRAIAHILGTLDDKIELNRRMNETLEATARAIFKSWFVDFDPVRAKMRGEQPPGLAPHIAALFPDELVETVLGEAPEGWRLGSFLDMADLLSGGTPSTSNPAYWNGNIRWVSAKDVSGAKGSFLLDTEKTITELGVQNSSTKILPALTTIITARGTVGNYCLLGSEMAMNQTNYGLRARDGVGDYFAFFSTARMIDHWRQQAYGTIFDTITTKTFQDTIAIRPPEPLLDEFDTLAEPIMMRVLINEQQSSALAVLRETLLPKLLSGELRIPDVEKLMNRLA